MGAWYSERKWENESEWWKIIGRAFKTQSVPKHPKAKKGKARGEKKSLGMLKINNVRQLFHCYSNLFKCYWRVFVPSRLLAAALMFEEAVPASAAVRPLPPPSTPSHTHPFLSSTLSAKTLSETEREKERESSEQYARQQVRGECVSVRGSDSEYMCEKGSLGGISPEMNFKKWASRLPISHVLYSLASPSLLLSHHTLLLLVLAGAMTDGRRGVGLINTRLTASPGLPSLLAYPCTATHHTL